MVLIPTLSAFDSKLHIATSVGAVTRNCRRCPLEIDHEKTCLSFYARPGRRRPREGRRRRSPTAQFGPPRSDPSEHPAMPNIPELPSPCERATPAPSHRKPEYRGLPDEIRGRKTIAGLREVLDEGPDGGGRGVWGVLRRLVVSPGMARREGHPGSCLASRHRPRRSSLPAGAVRPLRPWRGALLIP